MPEHDRGAQLAHEMMQAARSVAVAESLTGGRLSSSLAELPDAAQWYVGSVVAYSARVKHDVLEVPDVPVVSEPAAIALAEGVARLLGADLTIAVTGVGGPEPQDGVAPGTVWMARYDGGRTRARCFSFAGGPEEVIDQTCNAAIDWLLADA